MKTQKRRPFAVWLRQLECFVGCLLFGLLGWLAGTVCLQRFGDVWPALGTVGLVVAFWWLLGRFLDMGWLK